MSGGKQQRIVSEIRYSSKESKSQCIDEG